MKRLGLMGFFLTGILLGLSAHSATRVQFLPGNQNLMVNIVAVGPDGLEDTDYQTLFEALDLPVQNTLMGPGKGFRSSKNEISFTCAPQRKQCSIVFSRSAYLNIDSSHQQFQFKVSGEAAQFFAQIFPKNFNFLATDGLLQIQSSDELFLIQSR